jgi:hypothetical protein
MADNSIEQQVTVESEKQTITIGGVAAPVARPTISVEKEKQIIDEIERHCKNWRKLTNVYIACIVIFGLSAVSTSILVSIYTGSDPSVMSVETIKIMACISTISLGILTAFNLVTNATNARNAWKSLNAALMMYTAGSITIQQLIEHYQNGENQLGNFSFNYGTNSDKPGTYAHDIAAGDEEKKQKEAESEIRRQKDAEALRKNGITEVDTPVDGRKLNGSYVK